MLHSLTLRRTQLLSCLVLLAAAPTLAGSFTVSPIRVFLDAQKSTTVLKVFNNGAEKVTVQLSAVEWLQDASGLDQHEPTEELVFFPKIVSLEKGEERSVRIGYRGEAPPARERAFRIYAEELPVSKPGEMSVRMALRIGVPVFVELKKPLQDASIQKLELADGKLLVPVKNGGTAHFTVSSIRAAGSSAAGSEVFSKEAKGWYVLPGSSRSFTLELSQQECSSSTTITVFAELGPSRQGGNTSRVEARLAVDPRLCVQQRPQSAAATP